MVTYTFHVTRQFSTEPKEYIIHAEDDRQAWDELLDAVENDGEDLDMQVKVTGIEDHEGEEEDSEQDTSKGVDEVIKQVYKD